MHGPSFVLLALKSLEIIQATLASDLTLELLEPIEGHAGCVRSLEGQRVSYGAHNGRYKRDTYS